MADPWGFDTANMQGSSLSPDLMSMVTGDVPGSMGHYEGDNWMDSPQQRTQAMSPDGQWQLSRSQRPNGGSYFGDDWRPTYEDQYFLNKIGQGAGEPYWIYGPSGKYEGSKAGAHTPTYWQGALTVAGAALGMNALGAGMAGAGAAETGAGAAAAGGATSYTAAGAPIFGVIDEGAASASLAGMGAGTVGSGLGAGMNYTSQGAPLWGTVDEGAAGLSGAQFAPGAGIPGASGSDMDTFYKGSSLGGGPGAAMNPSFAGQAMSLLQSGGFSPEFATQSLFGGEGGGLFGGQGGGLFGGGGGGFGPGQALRYGSALSQLYSGFEGRKKAKQIAAAMQAASPTAAPPMRPLTTPYGMDLPSPGDITSAPGYQAGLEAVRRSMASQGYQGSGNMMMAMGKYGGDFYNQFVNQRIAANNQTLQAASTANDEDLRAWATLNDQKLRAAQAQAGPAYASMSSNALLTNGFGGLVRAFL